MDTTASDVLLLILGSLFVYLRCQLEIELNEILTLNNEYIPLVNKFV